MNTFDISMANSTAGLDYLRDGRRLPGMAIRAAMRKSRVTIARLADAMGITQKRVREVIQTGVAGVNRRDWRDGIRTARGGGR